MAEMTAEYEEIQVPDGGIANFMMSDEEMDRMDRDDADEVYGKGGISEFTEVASEMASLGRFGDDVVVHAQTGELIIPKKIIDDNPEIRDVVFQALRAQGIEDPEQYVVGSGSASINPETGLAEYGFGGFKSFVKKTVGAIKSVASKTVKVLKKVAPIVLPIALAMTPLGPVYGAALGSGIGTLLQGGSIKDALKSAAISGLSGAAFQGMTGPGTFSENVSNAFANPGARFSQTMQGVTGPEKFFRAYTPTPSAAPTSTGLQTTTGPSSTSGASEASLAGTGTEPVSAEGVFQKDISSAAPFEPAPADVSGPGETIFSGMDSPVQAPNVDPNAGTQTSFMDKLESGYNQAKEFLLPSGPSAEDVRGLQAASYKADIAAGLPPEVAASNAAKITGEQTLLQKYGPTAALIGGGMYLTGMFDTPEPTPEEESPLGVSSGPTGYEVFKANPEQFMVSNLDPAKVSYTTPPTQYKSYYDYYNMPSYGLQQSTPNVESPFYRQNVQMVEDGGEIFPRRNGGIMPNEGVPGKDSVRAMLMPGEFVMTTDAVRGAGNGDLRKGINTMYNVMANLERKGRVA